MAGRKPDDGDDNYFLKVILVGLFIVLMLIGIYIFWWKIGLMPFETLMLVPWLFHSQEDTMPGDEVGPVTLGRMKSIKCRIEEVGRKLGVPEDHPELAAIIVQCEIKERMNDKLDELIRDQKNQFDWNDFLRKSFAFMAGILKSGK
jgi:hypothetical protein